MVAVSEVRAQCEEMPPSSNLTYCLERLKPRLLSTLKFTNQGLPNFLSHRHFQIVEVTSLFSCISRLFRTN